MDKKTVTEITKTLKKLYPNPHTPLKHSNPWELLVAVILSAQCTDKRVNIVTADLFKKYTKIQDYAKAKQQEFEKDIRSTGFYKNKAKNIIATANIIIDEYGGVVPDSMEELIKLKGVARKTANVILNEVFNKEEGFVVDTHVIRLSNRLGLSTEKNPVKIEQDLMKHFPQKEWGKMALRIIFHGRNTCYARKPECDKCPLSKDCPSAFDFDHFKE